MRATIDAAGRLVIPATRRRQAGLRAGMPLEVRWRDGRIEIEPLPMSVRLVREGRLLSRFSIGKTEVHSLPKVSGAHEQRIVLAAAVQTRAGPLSVFVTH